MGNENNLSGVFYSSNAYKGGIQMPNSKEEEEYRMFFQILIDDIRYSKQQQWNTIYLTLIAIGAILGVFLAIQEKANCLSQSPSFRYFLIGVCVVISSSGILYIKKYYGDIGRYRYKSRLIFREKFSDRMWDIAKEGPDAKKDPEWYSQQRCEFLWFVIPFSILIGLALILVIWVVCGI